jgi:hypothetical protein
MERIEKNLQQNNENKLNELKREIQKLIDDELSGKSKTAHFMKIRGEEFNINDLTKEDMEMYYKIKNEKAELEEFKEYKEKFFLEKKIHLRRDKCLQFIHQIYL